jgi:repressor LexA
MMASNQAPERTVTPAFHLRWSLRARRSAPKRCAKELDHEMKMRFTEKQGQYLAFIYNYLKIHGCAPAEADLERHFKKTPPTIHQMILKLEEKRLISRVPGQPRSIRLLIEPEELPRLW